MALRDVTTSGSIGGGRVPLDFVSLGGMTVFSEEVWNLRFTMRTPSIKSSHRKSTTHG